MNPNERSSHPSAAQIEALVDYLEENPGLAKGFLRSQQAKEQSRRQWELLSVRLNSMGGTIKNYKQWTKYWSDKRCTLKKKVAANAAARRRTGGGVEDEVGLSAIEERIVALCGGESFSMGDTHLAIEPFPDTLPLPPHRVENIQHIASSETSQHTETPAAVEDAIMVLLRYAHTVASPPSQRRTEFSHVTERFLGVEEQRVEIKKSNARVLKAMLEFSTKRNRSMVEAITAMVERMAEAVGAVGV